MVSSLIPQPFTDDLSHGTGILLQLSAKRNGFGIEGYIPQAAILPIRVGNREEFYSAKVPLERIRRAFEFAKKHGIRLIGMSLSNVTSLWDKNEMQQLLEQYQNDFLILVASGNDGWNLEYGSKCTYVPVCNQADNLIKVGASDYPASNHGPVVDIWASSKVHIWKHYRYEPRAMRVYELKQTRSTSVAVPKVLAVAALMLKANSSLSPKELKTRILSARNLKGEIDPLLGVKMALH